MMAQDNRPISVVPPGYRPKPGDPIVWKEGADSKPALLVQVRDDDAIIHLDSAAYGDNEVAPLKELFLPRPAGTTGRRRRAFPSDSALQQRRGRGEGDAEAEIPPQPQPQPQPEDMPEDMPAAAATGQSMEEVLAAAVRDGKGATETLAAALGGKSPVKIVLAAIKTATQRQMERAQHVIECLDDLEQALEDLE